MHFKASAALTFRELQFSLTFSLAAQRNYVMR